MSEEHLEEPCVCLGMNSESLEVSNHQRDWSKLAPVFPVVFFHIALTVSDGTFPEVGTPDQQQRPGLLGVNRSEASNTSHSPAGPPPLQPPSSAQVQHSFGGAWTQPFATLIISVVVINQLIGPVTWRRKPQPVGFRFGAPVGSAGRSGRSAVRL